MCMLPVISTLLYPLLSAAAGLASASAIEHTIARPAASAAVVFAARYSMDFLPVVDAVAVNPAGRLMIRFIYDSYRIVPALCERFFGRCRVDPFHREHLASNGALSLDPFVATRLCRRRGEKCWWGADCGSDLGGLIEHGWFPPSVSRVYPTERTQTARPL